MYLVIGALTLLLVIGALIDIITRTDDQVRHLPKMIWILLVVILPLVGSIVWFVVGHDWSVRGEAVPFGDPRRQEAAAQRVRQVDTRVRDAEIEAELRLAEKEARIRRLEAQVEAKRQQREGGTEPTA